MYTSEEKQLVEYFVGECRPESFGWRDYLDKTLYDEERKREEREHEKF